MTEISLKKFSTGIDRILEKIPFISVLITGWQLASKGYAHYGPKNCRKQQWKIIFHTLFSPIFAYKWFEFLKSPDFNYIFNYRPRLYIKPFRTYISIKWNKKQKVKVILDTYRFLKNKGDAFGQVLTNPDGLIIANLMFDNTYQGYLKLGYHDSFRKEGELVLSLDCSQLGGKVISVSFSLEESTNGDWLCLIGCVQGLKNMNTPDAYKSTQKLLHGLRPNSFIIYAVQELSRHLGCTAIYCTGNSIQAFHKKHFIHLPWVHKINFNYDKFWDEVGGQNIGKGWFELPLMPARKDMQEISSNKRSMYRKRYELLDHLSLEISNTV
jgi:uncharacterized protein VirK/YbjX